LKKNILCTLIVILILGVAPSVVFAQDTPEHIRNAAINVLNEQIPGIGRPTSWQHQLISASDNALGCGLVGATERFANPVQVYVVSLFYDPTTFVFHVSADGQRVVACDSNLLFPSGASGSCPQDSLNISKLSVGASAVASLPGGAGVYSDLNDTGNPVTLLPEGTPVRILAGPDCLGVIVFWFVDYGGARGYMQEFSTSGFFSLTPADPNSTAGFGFPVAPSNYTSQTCPPDFSGYMPPRLYVGGMGQVEPGGVNNIIRQSYGRSAQHTGAEMPPGSIFDVIGGPECTGANQGDPIVWFQVVYNGTTGWTAESQKTEYYLAPYGVGVAGPGLGGITPDMLPSGTLPTSRQPLNSGTIGNHRLITQLHFGALGAMYTARDGSVAVSPVHPSGNGSAVVIYRSLGNPDLRVDSILDLPDPMSGLMAYSPDGSNYAVITATGAGGSADIIFYNAVRNLEVARISNVQGFAGKGVFSPDGSFFVYRTEQGEPGVSYASNLVLYNLTNGGSAVIHTSNIAIADFTITADNLGIVGIFADGAVRLWSSQTLQEVKVFFTNLPPSNGVGRVAVNPSGTRVAISGGAQMRVYDLGANTLLYSLTVYQPDANQTADIYALAFSPDGNMLAAAGGVFPLSTSGGAPIAIYDMGTGNQVTSISGAAVNYNLAFSPDGTLLLSQGMESVDVWGVVQ